MRELQYRVYETTRHCEYNEELFRVRARRSRRFESLAQLVVTLATSSTALGILAEPPTPSSAGFAWIWQCTIFFGAVAAAYLSFGRPGHHAATNESLAARWTVLRGEAAQLEIELKVGQTTDEDARARMLRIRSHFAGLDQEDLQPQDTKEGREIQAMIEARQGLEPKT